MLCDSCINGDAQRIGQITWMFYLKVSVAYFHPAKKVLKEESSHRLVNWTSDEEGEFNEILCQDYKSCYLCTFYSTNAQLEK